MHCLHLMKKFILAFALLFIAHIVPTHAQDQCIPEQQWINPATKEKLSEDFIRQSITKAPVVFIGEHHANERHHQWHIELLKQYTKRNTNFVIALEMLPQSKQETVTQWLEEKIDDNTFIKQLDWENIWGFDLQLYFPLFSYAKENHIRIIALNTEPELIKMVKQFGWSNIPEKHRFGLKDPQQPPREYLLKLAKSFQRHGTVFESVQEQKEAFKRFVEQQLVWDSAMAQRLSQLRTNEPQTKVFSFMGSWHIIDQDGAVFQYLSLQKENVLTIVPWSEYLDCSDVKEGFAHAIYFP